MNYEPFDPIGGEYDQVVMDYWDLIQVRYHMLRALKILRGEEVLMYPDMTREENAIWELEAGHKLNNHLTAEVEHIREIK